MSPLEGDKVKFVDVKLHVISSSVPGDEEEVKLDSEGTAAERVT